MKKTCFNCKWFEENETRDDYFCHYHGSTGRSMHMRGIDSDPYYEHECWTDYGEEEAINEKETD